MKIILERFDLEEIIDDNASYKDNIISLVMQVEKNDEELDKLKDDIRKIKQSQIKNETTKKEIKEAIKGRIASQEQSKIDKLNIENYLNLLEVSTNLEDLLEFMPKEENKDYDKIINFIMLSLQKDYVFFEKSISDSIQKQELETIKKELENINRMKNLVTQYREFVAASKMEQIQLPQQNAKIFYTKTESGNIKLLGDIKRIPTECYDEFLILFESIKSGNLKNPKVINSNNRFYGNPFMEVKLNSARITFEVLTNNIVVITGAFVKKVQTSKKYDLTMINNKQIYQKNKDNLLENMDDSSFIAEQNNITEEITKILKRGK